MLDKNSEAVLNCHGRVEDRAVSAVSRLDENKGLGPAGGGSKEVILDLIDHCELFIDPFASFVQSCLFDLVERLELLHGSAACAGAGLHDTGGIESCQQFLLADVNRVSVEVTRDVLKVVDGDVGRRNVVVGTEFDEA